MDEPKFHPPSERYNLNWRWLWEEDARWWSEVRATTAPRAIAKLKKELAEEYDFRAGDLIILEALRKDR